jgi:single-stranded-DNA-specific exonuclease
MRARPIERRAVPTDCTGWGLHPVLARVYGARGLTSKAELGLGLAQLLPVGSLPQVEAAAELLARHGERGGRILIIGDFDADGATASALMVRTLRRLGFNAVDYLVPDRFRFGYGLTPEIVALALERSPECIVTVDNGISSLDGVAAARAAGVDVLVTDHHLPGAELPHANCIVNPNLPGSTFGSRALAGVGVAFYVLAALGRRLGLPSALLAERLDLVALGTVADVVPLDRNNRVLVQQGLERIRAGHTVPGIVALASLAKRELGSLSAGDLGFLIAPRLNAAGRLDDMSIGIECLLTDDAERASLLAAQLDRLNGERRSIESKMQDEARAIVAGMRLEETGAEQPLGVCLFDPSWHPGVVGLVAARVREQLHRPAIAFAPAEPGLVRGSARSVPGVHIRDCLEAVASERPGMLVKFGGHAMAAGLTLEHAQLRAFAAAFAAAVARRADPALLAGILYTDGPLADHELCLDTARALRAGGPWGAAFAEPCFDGEFEVAEQRPLGEKHLKLWVRQGPAGAPVEALLFDWQRRALAPPPVRARVRMAYRLEVNAYLGVERPQLNVEYLEALPP